MLTSDECDPRRSVIAQHGMQHANRLGPTQGAIPLRWKSIIFSVAVRVSGVVVMSVTAANATGVWFVERDFEYPVKAGRNTAQRS